ncbi:MAG: hypothetical protein ABSD67_03635 [Terracidiphilus sp.]|jgi:hypothetical protein
MPSTVLEALPRLNLFELITYEFFGNVARNSLSEQSVSESRGRYFRKGLALARRFVATGSMGLCDGVTLPHATSPIPARLWRFYVRIALSDSPCPNSGVQFSCQLANGPMGKNLRVLDGIPAVGFMPAYEQSASATHKPTYSFGGQSFPC